MCSYDLVPFVDVDENQCFVPASNVNLIFSSTYLGVVGCVMVNNLFDFTNQFYLTRHADATIK